MRVDSVICLALLLASLAAGRAVSQDAAKPRSHPTIISVSLAQHSDSTDVEITLSKVVRADVSTIEHPDRLVFDFPGYELEHPAQRLVVNRGAVLAVRTARFSSAPPIARVVIDLKSPLDHEEAYVGNKLIIKLPSTGTAKRLTPAGNGSILAADGQPTAPAIDRALPKSSESALTKPAARPPLNPVQASGQLSAYALIARARGLTVPDLESLEAGAQADDLESETILGLANHAGTLLKLDDREALRLLRHSANGGFVGAEEAMGILCQLGFGMPPDKAQAVSWYTKAAQHGSMDAATNLALMYSIGDGIQKDTAKAAIWFRSAAEAGDATAQLNLASLFHRGEGLPQDDPQAVLWLTKAADQGLVPAMLELASWDLQPAHGNNLDAAIVWYKKAADLGDASAQAALGDIFSDQKFGRVDYDQAVNWYRKAADQGLRTGQLGLGERYLLGQGVPQDLEEARRWLTLAANQGNPHAQFLLAKMFEAGEGGLVDAAVAAKYYELASNHGIVEAQYRLGLMLASDRNNATSLVSAYKWLVLAQESVKESAATAQDLRKTLTPAQLDQAEREIDEWRTAHPRRNLNH
jgi:TPR repeat protein